MHRLALAALLVVAAAGCRRHHAPVVLPEEAPPAAPSVAVAPDLAVPSVPELQPPMKPAENVDLAGTEQPSESELRAQLDARLPSVRACVRTQGSSDPSARYQLRARIEPNGELLDADVAGLPGAKPCVVDALKGLRVTPFRGNGVVVSVPLSATGEALAAPRDGGAPPRDGG